MGNYKPKRGGAHAYNVNLPYENEQIKQNTL